MPNELKNLEAVPLAELAPRDRVLRAALALFYRHGIHSVGVDRIIAESGVAKMTFYKHFPSKSKLVAAYLAHKNECWRELLEGIAGDASRPPLERLLRLFDAVDSSIQCPNFRGCAFIKGLAEFGPDRDEPEVQEQLSAHFACTEKVISGLLKEIRPRDAKKLVQPVMSLICGSVVVAQATGRSDAAARNREFVRALLEGD